MTIVELHNFRPVAFWTVAGLMAAAVVGAYCVTAKAYVNHDVFVMAESAQSVLSGKSLYGTACWDNKPPLALLAYAVPQMIAPRSYLAVQGFLGVWLVLQSAVFVYFLRHEAAVATILGASALVLVPLMDKEFLWASSEHWHNLFALLVILPSFQLWRNCGPISPKSEFGGSLPISPKSEFGGSLMLSILTGAAVVLAMHCRQTGILLAMVPLVAIAGSGVPLRGKLAQIAGGIAGALAAWLGILALCAAIGNLNGYFDATFLAPGRYAERRISAVFQTAYFYFATYRNSALGLLGVAALIGCCRRRDFVLFGVVAIVTGLLIVVPARHHAHYMMQTLPLLALALQTCVARLHSASPSGARGVSFAVAGFLVMNGLFAVTTLPQGRAASVMTDLNDVAKALQAEAQTSDTMFAVGNESAYLYFATDIASVHPIFWDLFFGRLSATIPYPLEDVIICYKSTPPSLLVLSDEVCNAASATTAPGPDAQPCQKAVDLCWQLEKHNSYREIARLRGWVILRHE